MRVFDGSSGSQQLIVNTISMTQTGKDIEGNAEKLNGDLTKNMHTFENNYSSLSLPLCMRNILHSYATVRTVELGKMVQRRHTIGDLLTKAADLHALNENMQRQGFANLYQNVNSYYGSIGDQTDPSAMQRGALTQK